MRFHKILAILGFAIDSKRPVEKDMVPDSSTTRVCVCVGGHRKHTYSFSHTSLLSSLYLQLPKTAQFRPAHRGEAHRQTVPPPSRWWQQTLAQLAVLSWMESCTQSFGVRRIFRGLPHYLHYRPWQNAGAIFSEFFRSFRSTKYCMDP